MRVLRRVGGWPLPGVPGVTLSGVMISGRAGAGFFSAGSGSLTEAIFVISGVESGCRLAAGQFLCGKAGGRSAVK